MSLELKTNILQVNLLIVSLYYVVVIIDKEVKR